MLSILTHKRLSFHRQITYNRPKMKRMCLSTFSRLARPLATIYSFARVRIFGTSVPFYVTGNSSEFPVTLENSCPCTGIAFANSFIFLYNILIYHNVGDSVCQISLLRKYAVNITAWIFRTENPPRCRGGFKESEEFT